MDVKVQPGGTAGSERVHARVGDLSRSGANLNVDTRFNIGQILSLELPGKNGEIRTILASIVRVVPRDDGTWSLGCIFSLELSDADLAAIGARKVAAAGKDRRIAMRSSCAARAAFHKSGESANDAQHVNVLNISASGIGLLLPACLERGTRLNLDLFDKNGRKVCPIVASVVRATMHAGRAYAVGCSFSRELTEKELKSLL